MLLKNAVLLLEKVILIPVQSSTKDEKKNYLETEIDV